MIAKFYKIIFISLIFFHQNIVYAKNLDLLDFKEKNVSNYFSALVALNNNDNKSLNYFNLSNFLKETHPSYIEKYFFSLVRNGEIKTAVSKIKLIKNKKFINFFEAQLLLLLDSIKKKNYRKSIFYINNLKKYKEKGTFEFIILSSLEDYIYTFSNNKIKDSEVNNFGNFGLINKAFQKCYLDDPKTSFFFQNVITNDTSNNSSRYLFFYINYLVEQKNYKKIKNLSSSIDPLKSTLLVSQSKNWIDEENYKNFSRLFSCKNSNDIISEFLFLIANLYSSDGNLSMSNFYFHISNYFNPKFKFNLTLLAENYFEINNFKKAKKILNKISNKNEIYHWYKIKKFLKIIETEKSEKEALEYINSEFKKIKQPPLKIIFDMANILKTFKKYDLSILYYSKVLEKLEKNSVRYSEILYRRGGSYERLKKYQESDYDLLQSLSINPDEPHVLNYLAYSWLERNYKIEEAIQMLERAYEARKNDAYIIDSMGWAYYLIGNYKKAEIILKRAVEMMPLDPVVNDHYGDILWRLGRKIQANYFWRNVLTLDDIDDNMKHEINHKILSGLEKI